jgi:hypothetical protein
VDRILELYPLVRKEASKTALVAFSKQINLKDKLNADGKPTLDPGQRARKYMECMIVFVNALRVAAVKELKANVGLVKIDSMEAMLTYFVKDSLERSAGNFSSSGMHKPFYEKLSETKALINEIVKKEGDFGKDEKTAMEEFEARVEKIEKI